MAASLGAAFPGISSSFSRDREHHRRRGHGVVPVAANSSGGGGGIKTSTSPVGDFGLNLAEYEALPSIQAPKRVVLVRHGQSTWNEVGRIQGSSDFAVLTPKGEIQAETSRQMLIGDSFDACFHSPLARAKRTAEIIWAARPRPMLSVDDLREIDLYAFQGLMKNEGKQRYGDAYRKWQIDAPNFVIDGHFPVRELWVRAQNCWSRILSSQGSSILVVAHNAVNQALVATAAGLGPHYFRQLLQSNCGVTVLDFTPRFSGDGPPYTCLDRLNQTPSPPVAAGGGRKARCCLVLVCHGATESTVQKRFPSSDKETMNMLGVIQSRKTAELLLDVRAGNIFSGPQPCSVSTAASIAEVQEAADCLGADCVPRYVEVQTLPELDDMNWGTWQGKLKEEVAHRERWQDFLQHETVEGAESLAHLWERAGNAWKKLTLSLKDLEGTENSTAVVVAHETVLTALLAHCLDLSQAFLGSFRLDTAGVCVIDFPDGYSGKGVVRCWNYTAHLGRWAVPVTRPTLGDEEF
ncbi:probable 2-carboxy-D-arabinitol-1-phosphatase isoform X1 [Selaginella moellendorffii]|uniref:probable 2-carboxy-D-arabinitol-1-phosphatase isoform X1 n=1 Tax=Selaginella moellendorffii TaxID=88036 RepID=UPI000D1C831F|nr:probable 2-carboxy-D-arabinitol-1-phosphatase isoform X1 [Selaginella moellendorffii]|eukprot:XP_024527953.1 probable 2-carboxy-D-arabinitol-1-phosphatase isoform X1 [Selaginella moellendorffii]